MAGLFELGEGQGDDYVLPLDLIDRCVDLKATAESLDAVADLEAASGFRNQFAAIGGDVGDGLKGRGGAGVELLVFGQ